MLTTFLSFSPHTGFRVLPHDKSWWAWHGRCVKNSTSWDHFSFSWTFAGTYHQPHWPHPSLKSVQIFILVATLPPCSFPWALEENEPNSIVRRKSSLAQANSNIHCSGHSPKFRPKHVTSAQTMSVNFNILAQNTRPYAFCLLLDVNEETSIPDCC